MNLHTLTDKQLETLLIYAVTGSARETAQRLGVPEQRVRHRLSASYRKLGITSGVQAAFMLGLDRGKGRAA